MNEMNTPRDIRLSVNDRSVLSFSADNPPDENKIWQDDSLGRKEFAKNLTNLVSGQSNPLTVAVDGGWGTGKTFLLTRWQAELVNNGFTAIYFNAWEDDFCDDPLAAIIGQLVEITEDTETKDKIIDCAMPLVKTLFTHYAKKKIKDKLGIDGDNMGAIFTELFTPSSCESIKNYSKQVESKQQLKDVLTKMAKQIKQDTGKPLIFIIDELDRCRPTFSIELLERVKHIFAIPNMIFVLGINKSELTKSIQSIYGDIDAEDYLRKFITMSLLLPPANAEKFCENLITEHQIKKCFMALPEHRRSTLIKEEINHFSQIFPSLCQALKLTLRQIQYCTATMAWVAINLTDKHLIHPYMIATIIILRCKNPELYKKFIHGHCRHFEVLNYIFSMIGNVQDVELVLDEAFDIIEGGFYETESINNKDNSNCTAFEKLQNTPKEHTEFKEFHSTFSNRTLALEPKKRVGIGNAMEWYRTYNRASRTTIDDIVKLIELSGE